MKLLIDLGAGVYGLVGLLGQSEKYFAGFSLVGSLVIGFFFSL